MVPAGEEIHLLRGDFIPVGSSDDLSGYLVGEIECKAMLGA